MQSGFDAIDKHGTVLRRRKMGLKDYPSRWNRVTEVWEKGVTQIKSGFVGKGISKYDGIFDHLFRNIS